MANNHKMTQTELYHGLELLNKAAQKRKEAKCFYKTSSQRAKLNNEAQELENEVKKIDNADSIYSLFCAINELNKYKSGCLKKRRWILVLLTIIVMFIFCIIGLSLFFLSDFNNGGGVLMIHNLKRGLFVLLLQLLLFLVAVYSFIYEIKKSRLYTNAIHRLDLLIMRLNLDTDKDLVSPYRLDRELEMIYRLLES